MNNPTESMPEDTVYAGFGRRLVAYLLDFVFLGLMIIALSFVTSAVVITVFGNQDETTFTLIGVALGLTVLYFNEVYLVSSSMQASLGKRAMGLKVINTRGQRVHQGTALLRFICTYLSGLLFGIGYLMIAFTERKRALHDMIAETYVVVSGSSTRVRSASDQSPISNSGSASLEKSDTSIK